MLIGQLFTDMLLLNGGSPDACVCLCVRMRVRVCAEMCQSVGGFIFITCTCRQMCWLCWMCWLIVLELISIISVNSSEASQLCQSLICYHLIRLISNHLPTIAVPKAKGTYSSCSSVRDTNQEANMGRRSTFIFILHISYLFCGTILCLVSLALMYSQIGRGREIVLTLVIKRKKC